MYFVQYSDITKWCTLFDKLAHLYIFKIFKFTVYAWQKKKLEIWHLQNNESFNNPHIVFSLALMDVYSNFSQGES